MNQHKKRKFPGTSHSVQDQKKIKLDSIKNENLKANKKKKTQHKGSAVFLKPQKEGKTNETVTSVQTSDRQPGLKKKKKQWQSVKEKRKRLKKKYLNINNTGDKSTLIETDKTTQANLSEKKVKLPQTSNEYSSNWKNLMKTLNIPQTKKKKKKHDEKQLPSIPSGQTKKEQEKEPEIWFDDVDDILLDRKPESSEKQPDKLVKQQSFTGLTKDIAIDCEMVGVGWDGRDNQLARVSIVNHFGNCVYDKFVKPKEKVTDYRTHVSGIRPEDIENANDFEKVQKEVCEILKDRLLIGHAIQNDLKVLYVSHPKKMIRDSSRYKPFRQLFDGRNPSLKKLTAKVLGVTVQEGEHNSVQDAQAAMRLYTMNKKKWEKDFKDKHRQIKKGPKKKKKLKIE
ncbi:uncharacterized protein LOC127710604 [Mytilus californianus]|uniref:uncharacterized protein LOC127710604 n=1 Tax=Mytilus californianus TaxID=6549 RepID=UPI0022478627|nr:uncharacterized protein LOC127710604 [Mytilus californianus]XP_052072526.1 uncharacterized protein LOC127710604 [Mytilus californianus]